MRELAQDILSGWPVELGPGRPMLGLEAAELLMECVANTTGDYCETGSAYGGSAVMAGMAMEAVGRPGQVFCIDPFNKKSELEGDDAKLNQFWATIIHYDLHQRVIAFKQYNPPFPLAIFPRMFSVSLIDGSHYGDGPADDFNELSKRTTDYLLLDNAEISEVSYVIGEAIEKGGWELHKETEYESNLHKDKMVEFVALINRRKIEHLT